MKFFLITVLVLIWTLAVTAQDKFTILHLPRVTKYNKGTLNGEIAAAKDRQAVREIILRKNFPPGDIKIYITRKNNFGIWWTFNPSLRTESERTDEIDSQSRDVTSLSFGKFSEFKAFFNQKLIMLDTFKMEPVFEHSVYAPELYFVKHTCTNPSPLAKIRYDGRYLFFTKQLFGNCKQENHSFQLYNGGDSAIILAQGNIFIPGEEYQEFMLAMRDVYKKEYPKMKAAEIAAKIATYSAAQEGNFYLPQLINWLAKK